MPTDIQVIESLALFQELDNDEKQEIAELIQPFSVQEGEILTKQKEAAHSFFVTLSGNFMIYFKNGKAFTLHDKDNIIGISTVMTPFRYKGTTVALTDGEVLHIPSDKLLELIQSNASIGEKLMYKLNDVITQRAFYTEEPQQTEKEEEKE